MLNTRNVVIGHKRLAGFLATPEKPGALVIFAHASGSSRFTARSRQAADSLGHRGFATLSIDLLTEAEAEDCRIVFDIPLIGARVIEAIEWAETSPATHGLRLCLFGASTGAAAVLVAAARRADAVAAIVSRGGRPDLAGPALSEVRAATLLVVGGEDRQVLALNKSAMQAMHCKTSLAVVPGAGHLFEEEGTLDQALAAATQWYEGHLGAKWPFSADDWLGARH